MEPAGRDPGRAFGAPAVGPLTLCSQKKSSPFRTIFPPAWGMGPWTMPEVECRPGNYLGDIPRGPILGLFGFCFAKIKGAFIGWRKLNGANDGQKDSTSLWSDT
jgi:hypothetical protein